MPYLLVRMNATERCGGVSCHSFPAVGMAVAERSTTAFQINIGGSYPHHRNEEGAGVSLLAVHSSVDCTSSPAGRVEACGVYRRGILAYTL